MSGKGLTPPTNRLVKKVLNRSADRLMSNVKNKTLQSNQDRLIRSTGIKDPFKQIEKAWDLNTKSMNKKFFTETFQKNKGLSNKPSGRVNVAKRYATQFEYFNAKATNLSHSNVDRGYRHSSFSYYPKRLAHMNKSLTTGKASYISPNVHDPKIRQDPKGYSKLAKDLNKFNKETAKYGKKRNRLQGAFTKDKSNKAVQFAKTMGKVMNVAKMVTPLSLVGAIMQPKKVGDATLKKTINRNPNFPR